MATIKAPARLPELVKAAFAKALHEGDLSYFPTHVQDVRVGALSVSPHHHHHEAHTSDGRQLPLLTETVPTTVLALSRKQAQSASQAARHHLVAIAKAV